MGSGSVFGCFSMKTQLQTHLQIHRWHQVQMQGVVLVILLLTM